MHMLKTIKKLVKIYCQPAHEMKKEKLGSNCTVWPCEVTVICRNIRDLGWKMAELDLGAFLFLVAKVVV